MKRNDEIVGRGEEERGKGREERREKVRASPLTS